MFNISIKDKEIKIKNLKEAIKDNVNSYECQIEFSEHWQDLAKTIVFKQGDTVQYCIVDTNNRVKIPSACLKGTEMLYIGAFGTVLNETNQVVKRFVTNLEALSVFKGALIDASNADEIENGTIYDQYIASINEKIAQINAYVEQANTAKNAAIEAKTQAGTIRDDAKRIHDAIVELNKTSGTIIQAKDEAIAAKNEAQSIRNEIGDVNNLFQSVSNGKTLVASAITDKGVNTANDATFQTMANNISLIENFDVGNLKPEDIVEGVQVGNISGTAQTTTSVTEDFRILRELKLHVIEHIETVYTNLIAEEIKFTMLKNMEIVPTNMNMEELKFKVMTLNFQEV